MVLLLVMVAVLLMVLMYTGCDGCDGHTCGNGAVAEAGCHASDVDACSTRQI